MVHMERDTDHSEGYHSGGAILDEVSAQSVAVFQGMKYAGRGFGKGSAFAQSQATLDELHAAKKRVDKARIDRKRERQALELHRRRYEFPTGYRTGGAQAKQECPHLVARHYDEAHPRYGDRFPITKTVLRRVKAKHKCIPGVEA